MSRPMLRRLVGASRGKVIVLEPGDRAAVSRGVTITFGGHRLPERVITLSGPSGSYKSTVFALLQYVTTGHYVTDGRVSKSLTAISAALSDGSTVSFGDCGDYSGTIDVPDWFAGHLVAGQIEFGGSSEVEREPTYICRGIRDVSGRLSGTVDYISESGNPELSVKPKVVSTATLKSVADGSPADRRRWIEGLLVAPQASDDAVASDLVEELLKAQNEVGLNGWKVIQPRDMRSNYKIGHYHSGTGPVIAGVPGLWSKKDPSGRWGEPITIEPGQCFAGCCCQVSDEPDTLKCDASRHWKEMPAGADPINHRNNPPEPDSFREVLIGGPGLLAFGAISWIEGVSRDRAKYFRHAVKKTEEELQRSLVDSSNNFDQLVERHGYGKIREVSRLDTDALMSEIESCRKSISAVTSSIAQDARIRASREQAADRRRELLDRQADLGGTRARKKLEGDLVDCEKDLATIEAAIVSLCEEYGSPDVKSWPPTPDEVIASVLSRYSNKSVHSNANAYVFDLLVESFESGECVVCGSDQVEDNDDARLGAKLQSLQSDKRRHEAYRDDIVGKIREMDEIRSGLEEVDAVLLHGEDVDDSPAVLDSLQTELDRNRETLAIKHSLDSHDSLVTRLRASLAVYNHALRLAEHDNKAISEVTRRILKKLSSQLAEKINSVMPSGWSIRLDYEAGGIFCCFGDAGATTDTPGVPITHLSRGERGFFFALVSAAVLSMSEPKPADWRCLLIDHAEAMSEEMLVHLYSEMHKLTSMGLLDQVLIATTRSAGNGVYGQGYTVDMRGGGVVSSIEK